MEFLVKSKIKILIVEDDVSWRESIRNMFKEILPSASVKCTGDGREALNWIEEKEKYDLISLDINLGSTHLKTPDGKPDLKIQGCNGLTILRKARELKSCNGVVVITAAPHDQTLEVVITDEEERNRIQMTPSAYLEELFPSRNLYLNKPYNRSDVDKAIVTYKKSLTLELIRQLCIAPSPLAPPYIIDWPSGDLSTMRSCTIQSKESKKTKGKPITHKSDFTFLFSLCKMPDFVSKDAAYLIYEQNKSKQVKPEVVNKKADSYIASFRRRLRSAELDPNMIFVDERGRGWKLSPQVTIKGLSTVNIRGPGTGSYDMTQDIESSDNDSVPFDE